MTLQPLALTYAAPLAALWLGWTWLSRRKTAHARQVLEENREAGLAEPSSLHPLIDPARCLGCAACVRACPEAKVIGIIDGKAALIEPAMCVGHGACQKACPTDAISLVFGTETRGVDIPVLNAEFETTVPGIYIAGELGGMGLVKNAIEQGRQAMVAIGQRLKRMDRKSDMLDVVIVGCGPAGISASLGAKEAGLRFATLDQSTLGGTVSHFPRGKLVMTAPARLPLVGEVKFSEISKEALINFWSEVIANAGLEPRFEERVVGVAPIERGFCVTSDKAEYRARTVLLAIGRRGTPRPLGVPGEHLPKVTYRLIDPEQYADQRVLVVGGGDSAIEAACSIAEQPGSQVILSYRGASYSRAKRSNRDRLAGLVRAGRIDERLESQVEIIEEAAIMLSQAGVRHAFGNDAVVICAGGLLPNQFLREIGIAVDTKFGTS
jgi:thioredoxin reductase (NADPH)